MTKRSKNPRYDDPSAFAKRFPRIELLHGVGTPMTPQLGINEQSFKMGTIRATLSVPNAEQQMQGYFMSVHGRDQYPDWDSIVWLRYNLIPDSAVMVLVLPNLNSYINQDDTPHRNVFTLEQKGWSLDPAPVCPTCGTRLEMAELKYGRGVFVCPYPAHEVSVEIDLTIWNEQHGNGLLARNGVTP